MKLSLNTLSNAWQFAHDALVTDTKEPRESIHQFVTRCWVKGLMAALSKEGKTLCIKQGSDYSPLELDV